MDLKCRTLLKKTAWPGEGMQLLKNMGFKTAAMALRDDSVGIDNQTLQAEEKLAIVLGTEGDGLSSQTIADCDYTVKIPMSHGVDSLNVAAASAVASGNLGILTDGNNCVYRNRFQDRVKTEMQDRVKAGTQDK